MPDYLSPREACSHFPGRPHVNTVRRWMNEGAQGVKLQSIRFAGKRLTTVDWCKDFISAVQVGVGTSSVAHHEASAKLDALGI